MVHFKDYLEHHIVYEWSHQYMDYNKLKDLLNSLVEQWKETIGSVEYIAAKKDYFLRKESIDNKTPVLLDDEDFIEIPELNPVCIKSTIDFYFHCSTKYSLTCCVLH